MTPLNSNDIISTYEIKSRFEVRLEQLFLGPFLYILLPYLDCRERMNSERSSRSSNDHNKEAQKKNDHKLSYDSIAFRVVGRLSTNKQAVCNPVYSDCGFLDVSSESMLRKDPTKPYVVYFSSVLSFPCSMSDLTLLSRLELSLYCVDLGFFFGHIILSLFGSNGILRQGRCLVPFNVYPSLELATPSLGCGEILSGGVSGDDKAALCASFSAYEDLLFHPLFNIFDDDNDDDNVSIISSSSSSSITALSLTPDDVTPPVSKSDSTKSTSSFMSGSLLRAFYENLILKRIRKTRANQDPTVDDRCPPTNAPKKDAEESEKFCMSTSDLSPHSGSKTKRDPKNTSRRRFQMEDSMSSPARLRKRRNHCRSQPTPKLSRLYGNHQDSCEQEDIATYYFTKHQTKSQSEVRKNDVQSSSSQRHFVDCFLDNDDCVLVSGPNKYTSQSSPKGEPTIKTTSDDRRVPSPTALTSGDQKWGFHRRFSEICFKATSHKATAKSSLDPKRMFDSETSTLNGVRETAARNVSGPCVDAKNVDRNFPQTQPETMCSPVSSCGFTSETEYFAEKAGPGHPLDATWGFNPVRIRKHQLPLFDKLRQVNIKKAPLGPSKEPKQPLNDKAFRPTEKDSVKSRKKPSKSTQHSGAKHLNSSSNYGGWVHVRSVGSLRRSTYRSINCYKLLDLYDRNALPMCSSSSSNEHSRARIQHMCEKYLIIALERFGFLSLCLPAFPAPVLYALHPHSLSSFQPQAAALKTSGHKSTRKSTSHIPDSIPLSPNHAKMRSQELGSQQNTFSKDFELFRSTYLDDPFGWEWKFQVIKMIQTLLTQPFPSRESLRETSTDQPADSQSISHSHYESLQLFETRSTPPTPSKDQTVDLQNAVASASAFGTATVRYDPTKPASPRCRGENSQHQGPGYPHSGHLPQGGSENPHAFGHRNQNSATSSDAEGRLGANVRSCPGGHRADFSAATQDQAHDLTANSSHPPCRSQSVQGLKKKSIGFAGSDKTTTSGVCVRAPAPSSKEMDQRGYTEQNDIGKCTSEETKKIRLGLALQRGIWQEYGFYPSFYDSEKSVTQQQYLEHFQSLIKSCVGVPDAESTFEAEHQRVLSTETLFTGLRRRSEDICTQNASFPEYFRSSSSLRPNASRKSSQADAYTLNMPTRKGFLSSSSSSKLPAAQMPTSLNETYQAISLVSRPASTSLSQDHKYILWKNREILRQRGIGLSMLVTAADSTLPPAQLSSSLSSLFSSWPQMTIETVLELLSPFCQHPDARQFAVNSLKSVPDLQICRFLPQLIQAVRYDMAGPQSTLLDFLIDRAAQSPLIASKLHWGLLCEFEDIEGGHLFIRGQQRLIDKLSSGCSNPDNLRGWQVIELQKKLVRQLRYLSAQIRGRRDRADQKTHRLRSLLTSVKPASSRHIKTPKSQSIEAVQDDCYDPTPAGFTVKRHSIESIVSSSDDLDLLHLSVPIPLPVEPHHLLIGIIPEESFVVRSSQYPIVIACRVLKYKGRSSGTKTPPEGRGIAYSSHNKITTEEYVEIMSYWGQSTQELLQSGLFEEEVEKYLFKTGDDLRQDQLVTQLIGMMHELLMSYGSDYHIVVYHVCSLSRHDGLIEFVQNSASLSSIKKLFPTLRQYFASKADPALHPLRVPLDVLDKFIKSCSAFSVITFLLGVGDRHLENLMVTDDGRLFHVDFGFILGEDPKPFPPPMKLCSEIIDALGGIGSEGYTEFQLRCCRCFRCLRRHSKLIIDTLLLMTNSGIRCLKNYPVSVITRVQQKFQLDMTESEAETYLLNVVGVSANALFPAVVDKFHEWTIYWK